MGTIKIYSFAMLQTDGMAFEMEQRNTDEVKSKEETNKKSKTNE